MERKSKLSNGNTKSRNSSFIEEENQKENLNPFMLFCKEENAKLKKGEVCSLKTFGMKWDILSMDQKEVYMKQFEENKKKYDEEKEREKKIRKSIENNKKKPSNNGNNGRRSNGRRSLSKDRKSIH